MFESKLINFVLLLVLLSLFLATPRIYAADQSVADMHDSLFAETRYPSAATCKTCHATHYREWSASPHAYAQLSPVANAMASKISILTNGTNGDFCVRCHTQVGMSLNEKVFMPNADRHPVSREGITCVTCHRQENGFGKVSGRLPIKEGDIFHPVYGPHDNKELRRVIESGEYDVTTQKGTAGRAIHTDAKELPAIRTSAFCGSCHDVNHVNGFRLEEAFSEYKAAPAARKGISCQDCHMSKVQGLPSGYFYEPIAIVGGKPTKPRKRTNHLFVGPDYSIVHPGIFPHNSEAAKMATVRQWLSFDYEAGWGTDAFEENVKADTKFPKRWAQSDDRYAARQILNENFKLLDEVKEERKKILQLGYQLGDVIVKKANEKGIDFKVQFRNPSEGHNVPTGFDAERVVYLEVTVVDKNGKTVFQSGDLDPNGDLRDPHSIYVHEGLLKEDKYLFSLQSKFIVRMAQGGEREQVLAVNNSADPLPFIRPPTRSTLLVGRNLDARKHRKSIRPLSSKWPRYKVKKSELVGSEGPYRATIKLIAGMVPVNLVHEIQDAGFDYDMTPRQVADLVVKGYQVLWEKEVLLSQ